MRLIDVYTIAFREFPDPATVPPYLILSHRWDRQEVTFTDFHDVRRRETMEGWSKIKNMCQIGRQSSVRYIWIDSCCIDQRSDTEQNSAVNSMWNWYKNSDKCIVFMKDVRKPKDFGSSVWFSRGWTLQELLAPKQISFYDSKWNEFGTRSSMMKQLTRTTGIASFENVRATNSVACRLSWINGRQTTRPEDIAYCLMGLFDIHIATSYGEGVERAFRRLQLEIIMNNDDDSIFAWSNTHFQSTRIHAIPSSSLLMSGLLAPSPTAFLFAGKVHRQHKFDNRKHCELTNRGFQIEMPADIRYPFSPGTDIFRVHGRTQPFAEKYFGIARVPMRCSNDDGIISVYLAFVGNRACRVGDLDLLNKKEVKKASSTTKFFVQGHEIDQDLLLWGSQLARASRDNLSTFFL